MYSDQIVGGGLDFDNSTTQGGVLSTSDRLAGTSVLRLPVQNLCQPVPCPIIWVLEAGNWMLDRVRVSSSHEGGLPCAEEQS